MTGVELTAHADGTIIPIRAQPGARRDAIVGVHAGALRVAVTAAPERGRANEAIAAVLAEALGCRPSQVALLSGAASRQKRFLVAGLAPEQLRGRLADLGPGR